MLVSSQLMLTNTLAQIQTLKTQHHPSSPSTVVDIEIQDIEGVGPTTARKLKEAGIVSVMDLAVTSADELAVDLNSSKDTGSDIYNGSSATIARV